MIDKQTDDNRTISSTVSQVWKAKNYRQFDHESVTSSLY